jgi:hypothetical protein
MKALILLVPLLIAREMDPPVEKPPFSIKLDQEKYFTDTLGIANPNTIINSKPGDTVRIYFSDGTYFSAIVKTTEMSDQGIFKVFGEMTSPNNTGFGFVLSKDGVFAGAVVQRNENITYHLQYDEVRKGYIFKFVKTEKDPI